MLAIFGCLCVCLRSVHLVTHDRCGSVVELSKLVADIRNVRWMAWTSVCFAAWLQLWLRLAVTWTMGDIDVLKAQIVRRDANEPWGFRLQGGSDVGQPLTIARVRTLHVLYLFLLSLMDSYKLQLFNLPRFRGNYLVCSWKHSRKAPAVLHTP